MGLWDAKGGVNLQLKTYSFLTGRYVYIVHAGLGNIYFVFYDIKKMLCVRLLCPFRGSRDLNLNVIYRLDRRTLNSLGGHVCYGSKQPSVKPKGKSENLFIRDTFVFYELSNY